MVRFFLQTAAKNTVWRFARCRNRRHMTMTDWPLVVTVALKSPDSTPSGGVEHG